MKKYILMCMLAVSLLTTHAYAKAVTDAEKIDEYVAILEDLSNEKLQLIMQIYVFGNKHDLGYSLVAVAWKESDFGNYLVNISDGKYGSFGLYHIRLDYASIRNKITTDWGRSRYAEKLLHDFNISSMEAVTNLMYWAEYMSNTKNPYQNMFSGYNGGVRGHILGKPKAYGKDAVLRVKALKRFFKKNNILAKLKKEGLI